jgi:hypothetical protein
MRGSALSSSDEVVTASAPRVLAGDCVPVHPRQAAARARLKRRTIPRVAQ